MLDPTDHALVGHRTLALTKLAFLMAEAELTNNEMALILGHMSEEWGKYSERKPYTKWSNITGLINHVRKTHPATGGLKHR